MNGLNYKFTSVVNFAVRDKFFKKIESGKPLSAYREFHLSVEMEVDELHDRLATMPGLSTTRFDEQQSAFESDGDLIHIRCAKRKHYSSMHIRLWTFSRERASELRQAINQHVEDVILKGTVFNIDWHFHTVGDGIQSVRVDEMADERLNEDAYPTIDGGVHAFIERFLAANEPILVIQGPPGTGKTRLVRAILAAMSHRAKDDCRIMFTGDGALFDHDEIFMKFIGSGHQAIVVEDADHLLRPRKDGNTSLHRFLTISDGIVRAQGRKIIFTSNLPNLGDIDDALLRPGRCFACLTLPRLGRESTDRLLPSIHTDPIAVLAAAESLYKNGAKSYSLAEIYATRPQRVSTPA